MEHKTNAFENPKKEEKDLNKAENLSFTAGIVDTTDVLRGKSYRAASEKMTADKKDLKGFKGFLKKIWKYNYAETYYHEKYRSEIKESMLIKDNFFTEENIDVNKKEIAQNSFKKATLERFIPDIKEMIEKEIGEERQELSSHPETESIKSELKKAINQFADGQINEADFEEIKRKIFLKLKELKNQKIMKDSETYVDNFLEIAVKVKEIKDNIKTSSDHKAKLAEFDFDINLILGKAKDGIKTEKNYNLAEKTIESLRKTKLGSLINETTLAAAVGLTYSIGTALSQQVIRSKALAIGTVGLSAAVSASYAGVKESQMQKREKETLEVRSASNLLNFEEEKNKNKKEISDLEVFIKTVKDKKEEKNIRKKIKQLKDRQEELATREGFIYKKKPASELTNSLNESLFTTEKDGTKIEKTFDSSKDIDKVLNNLAEIEARLEISNEKSIDLISYSQITNVEEERIELLKAKWTAKKCLNNIPLSVNSNWEDKVSKLKNVYRSDLLKNKDHGVEKKDKLFNKYKNKKVLKKTTQALLVGASLGVAFQEGFALLSDKQEGLIENLFKGSDRNIGEKNTALMALKEFILGANVEKIEEIFSDNCLVELPKGVSLSLNPDGTYNLIKGSNVLADNLSFNPNGAFTEEAKNILEQNNINFTETETIIDPGETEIIVVPPDQYISENPDNFKEVSRQLWFDNNTPMYEGPDGKLYGADLNELKTQWGGNNGSGINLETNSYEMDVFKMASDGSFTTINGQEFSVDAQELIKEGKLKFLFSLSGDTQNKVIELAVNPETGKISVPLDSEYGKLLFGEENGQAILKAKFAEVATSQGLNKAGAEEFRVLSTVVGQGIKGVEEEIAKPPITGALTSLDIPQDWTPPPFVPITARKPLEKIADKGFIYYSYQGGFIEKEEKDLIKKRISETLLKDPKAKLDHYKEIKNYFGKMEENYLKELSILSKEMGKMSKKNKVSVCIPVAGHQEGDKIYQSLKNYTYQKANIDNYEICLFINHPEKDREGKKIKPDKTLKEIERFKKDHPNINLKTIYKAIPNKKANIGFIRKLLNDTVLLRHHQRGEKVDDLIMISNDADNLGVDPRYIQNFIDRFKKDPKIDGILGQIDWDPEAYTKYPLIHVGTRLDQYYTNIIRNQRKTINSSGANFSFKSSIYAGVGGYLDDIPCGEDVVFGKSIAIARGGTYETQTYGNSASRMFTSARRAINVLKEHHLAPIEQWNKGFSAFDDEIRKMDLKDLNDELVDYNNPEYLNKLKEGLEYIINRTLNVYESWNKLGKDHFSYKKTINKMGIDYKLNKIGDIQITDMKKLVANLKVYQQEGVLQRDARAGKIEAVKKLKEMRELKI